MFAVLQKRRKLVDHVRLQRMECRTVIGLPDVYFKTVYSEGWMELKQISSIGRSIKIPFRPGQYKWIKYHVELRGHAILAVSCANIWYCFKNQWIKEIYSRNDFLGTCFFKGEAKDINLLMLLQK